MSMETPGGYLGQGGERLDEYQWRDRAGRHLANDPDFFQHYVKYAERASSYVPLDLKYSELYGPMRLGIPSNREIDEEVIRKLGLEPALLDTIQTGVQLRPSPEQSADWIASYVGRYNNEQDKLKSFYKERGLRRRGKTDSAVGQPGAETDVQAAGEPRPVVGTQKEVPYPATSQLLLPDVAPTSKTVQYPVPDPPTSMWPRIGTPQERRLQRLQEEWSRRRGDSAWTQTPANSTNAGQMNPQQYGTLAAVLGPDGKPLPDPQREQAVQARIARAMNGEGMAPGPGSGTLDPASQPTVRNADGTVSTVRTIGIEVDGKHVLIPTVSPDGKVLTDEQAIEMFRSSGKHLGVFNSREESDAAGRALSQQEARRVGSSGTLTPAETVSGFVYGTADEDARRDGVTRRMYVPPTDHYSWGMGTPAGAITTFNDAGRSYSTVPRIDGSPVGQMYGNMPQPPAAGQSASGTLTPEQMQQMSSPSPDARRYDGLNYKSNRVVGQSMAVSGGMAGNFVGDRQRQAISQMTSMANRMAEGRGGEPMRQGVAALEMAIQSGDTSAIESAEANLRTLLSPMLDKFDARFRGEVGDIGIDVRDQFMQTLKARIQAGTAGLNRGMPMQPQASAGTGGPRPPAPQRPGAGGQAAPQQPIRTPSGLTIHEFGSMEDAMSSSAKGGTIKSGDMVRIAGSNYTAVPAYDQYGNPEWGFVPAVVFGGGSTGSPEVAIPDPFKQGMTPEEWGDSLSEIQRQTMIDSLLTNPAMRSALDRDTLNKVDAIRRSRQGLLRSPMSPRDREAAMARLKSEENAALFAAMGVVASKGRGAALFASDFADQQRARAQADAQIKSDMDLERSIRLAEATANISEQQAEARAIRDAMVKDREREITAAMEEQKRAANAERQRVANFKVPLSSEAALAYVESGSMANPESSPAVASAWNSLDDQQKQLAVDLLTDFAKDAPPPPRMQYRSRGGRGLEGEQDQFSAEGAEPVTVQSAINPEAHLPERDLIQLFESIRNMPTPPSPTTQQTDLDDPTKEFEQSSMDARKSYEAQLSEWRQGVGKILMQDRPPQYSAEYYRKNPDAVTMVQSRFSDWETKVFRPAVDAAKESKDPAQLREALGDLYSWVVVMENAGLPTNYQNYQGIDMNNGREAFVRSVMKAMPASN